jgi:hypothetical protein
MISQKSTATSTRHSNFWQSRELIVCYPGRVALGSLLDFSEAAGYYGLVAFLAALVSYRIFRVFSN